MCSRTIVLILLLSPLTLTYRPDTVPDSELRPYRPPFPEDLTTTQAPVPSRWDPITLPRLPFGGDEQLLDDYEYEDEVEEEVHHHHHVPVQVWTYIYPTTPKHDAGTTVEYTEGQQEKLSNSSGKDSIRWKLVIAVTALLYVVSTFLLS